MGGSNDIGEGPRDAYSANVGFQMGPEDRPFSERYWGLGRQIAPTAAGRRGCLLMLGAAFVLIVVAVVIALVAGTF